METNTKKRVSFKSQYTILKWAHGEKCEKSLRKEPEIIQGENVEQEIIIQHETVFQNMKSENENKNKKEICSDRIRNRDQLTTGTSNPFMIQNNYLDDLSNQDIYLRPKDSNIKNNENKYLKMQSNK